MTKVRLREVDLAEFSKALALLYSDSDLPSLSSRITACLHALFDCDVASFDLFDDSALKWSTVVVSPVIQCWDQAVEVLQRHANQHPIVTNAARNKFPNAIRTSDLMSLREYQRTGLYNEFFRCYLLKTDCQLGFVAKPSSTLTVGASVNRRRKDFSAEECTLLEHLRPHLLQAYVTAQSSARTLGAALDERECSAALAGGAMCQIDARGKIKWMTSGVERLMERFFSTEVRKTDHLPGSLLRALQPRLHPDRGMSEQQLQAPRSWEWIAGDATLSVRVAATLGEGQWHLLFTESRHGKSAEELTERHGLSKREGEVLLWLSQGKTSGEIGIILEISPRTVEKHIERLFEKLGVYSRAAAIHVTMDRRWT